MVCVQCRYAYEPTFQCWKKNGKKPADFERPLSKAIANFPVPSSLHRKSGVKYYQQIKDGKFHSEGIVYWSNEEKNKIVSKIVGYLERQKLQPGLSESAFEDRKISKIGCKSEDKWFLIEVALHGRDIHQTCVHAELKSKEAITLLDGLDSDI